LRRLVVRVWWGDEPRSAICVVERIRRVSGKGGICVIFRGSLIFEGVWEFGEGELRGGANTRERR
jgi:hypothetical protein